MCLCVCKYNFLVRLLFKILFKHTPTPPHLTPPHSHQVQDLREVLSYMDTMETKIRTARTLCDQTMQVSHDQSHDQSHDLVVYVGFQWWCGSVEGEH